MGREYKIIAKPLEGADLSRVLQLLPSPIQMPQMEEIYNFKVEKDGYYLVDHLVNRAVAAQALRIFVDAGLSAGQEVIISEP